MSDLVGRLKAVLQRELRGVGLVQEAADRIEELEKINTASEARIWDLEASLQFVADAIENGDEIEFIPEKKT